MSKSLCQRLLLYAYDEDVSASSKRRRLRERSEVMVGKWRDDNAKRKTFSEAGKVQNLGGQRHFLKCFNCCISFMLAGSRVGARLSRVTRVHD